LACVARFSSAPGLAWQRALRVKREVRCCWLPAKPPPLPARALLPAWPAAARTPLGVAGDACGHGGGHSVLCQNARLPCPPTAAERGE